MLRTVDVQPLLRVGRIKIPPQGGGVQSVEQTPAGWDAGHFFSASVLSLTGNQTLGGLEAKLEQAWWNMTGMELQRVAEGRPAVETFISLFDYLVMYISVKMFWHGRVIQSDFRL